MRWLLTWTLIGALLGVVVATLIAPFVLQKLLASTGAEDAMCQCTQLVQNTTRGLIRTQVWGIAIGAVTFPAVAGVVRWQWRRRKKAETPAEPVDGSSDE